MASIAIKETWAGPAVEAFAGRRQVKAGQTVKQAPVYDILPATIAVFSYAIGSRKLSVNE